MTRTQHGFTLVEVVLSLAIISIVAALSLPFYAAFSKRNDLANTAQQISTMLRRAQVYARSMYGDSEWGFALNSGSVTVFKGASYATRDATYDEQYDIPASVSTSGLSALQFAKLTGNPSTTGSIVLTANVTDTRTVTINAKGTVSY